MQLIFDTFKNTGTLHHGYCIEGDTNDTFSKLCVFLERELDFPIIANPDFVSEELNSFGIDDARRLKEIHATKSFREDARKIFIIRTNFITHEAQNSLLKMFEEPGEGNHFFILTPAAHILLPTLKSRLLIVQNEGEGGRGEKGGSKKGGQNANTNAGKIAGDLEAATFLKSSPPKRLKIVSALLAEIEAEKKTKADAIHLVETLLKELHAAKSPQKYTKEDVAAFEELMKCRDYLGDRAASTKLLLEHIALILPVA